MSPGRTSPYWAPVLAQVSQQQKVLGQPRLGGRAGGRSRQLHAQRRGPEELVLIWRGCLQRLVHGSREAWAWHAHSWARCLGRPGEQKLAQRVPVGWFLIREGREPSLDRLSGFVKMKMAGREESRFDEPRDWDWTHCPVGWDAQGSVSGPFVQLCGAGTQWESWPQAWDRMPGRLQLGSLSSCLRPLPRACA